MQSKKEADAMLKLKATGLIPTPSWRLMHKAKEKIFKEYSILFLMNYVYKKRNGAYLLDFQ